MDRQLGKSDLRLRRGKEAAEAIGNYTPNREKRGPSEGLTHYLRKDDDGRFRWHWDPAVHHEPYGTRSDGG